VYLWHVLQVSWFRYSHCCQERQHNETITPSFRSLVMDEEKISQVAVWVNIYVVVSALTLLVG